MRKNPHVRICGGLGSATTLVYPTAFVVEVGRPVVHEPTPALEQVRLRVGRLASGRARHRRRQHRLLPHILDDENLHLVHTRCKHVLRDHAGKHPLVVFHV